MTDPWHELTRYTKARIAQGRVGASLPTEALLDFQFAHAAARDAVHQPWQLVDFANQVQCLGLEVLSLSSRVSSRTEYLQRPDKGRHLSEQSRLLLDSLPKADIDVVIIVSDGLSSSAVHQHGLALLKTITASYLSSGFRLAPICLVANARVALADDIGEQLQAKASVIIIGERPGLSAADSLGVYFTHNPHIGNSDAERNCISNIRPPHGLGYALAANKLLYLTHQAKALGFSGVALKDDMVEVSLLESGEWDK